MSFEEPEPAAEAETAPLPAVADETEHHTAKRLMLLLGFAYLMLAALASGLGWTAYFADHDGRDREPQPQGVTPPSVPSAPARTPERDPNAPGLHTRPDGSRYLVVPIPPPWHGPVPTAALAPGGAA
ncbi:hypothetical protein [Glycomyces halotolerans]